MSGKTVTVKGHDGAFAAYLATPSTPPRAAVVVIQEIFGVNAVMRQIADQYAAAGYLALCPDLFWRIEPNIQLTDQSEAEWKRAFALFGAFNVDNGIDDIDASIDYLRGAAGVQKVGAVGFCLGGLLAYLTAARTDVDAAVGFYGVTIEQRLEEAEKIAQPLMLHIASKDQFVSPQAQETIKAALHNHPQVTIHIYEGQDHAFARAGGAHYDKAAAELANRRTADFFRQKLLA
ncbi:MAG: dienelactone hydrolase family protein [Hyphomonadaceae bacterium]